MRSKRGEEVSSPLVVAIELGNGDVFAQVDILNGVEQVDAFVDKAEQRLAAMRSDVVRRALKRYVARS